MRKFKKLIFVTLTAIGGLLLTLAGVSLINLSQNLILYAGILLIILAGFSYFFMD